MERNFSPPKGRSLAIYSLIGLLLIAAILFLLITGSTTVEGGLAIGLVVIGILLLVPLGLIIYRIFTIITTVYTLNRDFLEVKWGLRRDLIPMREIDWVHQSSDFETPLLVGLSTILGSYYGEIDIKGLGKTLFVATSPDQMILIKLSQAYLVISPSEPQDFTQTYKQLAQLGSLQLVQPQSENLRMLWQRVIDDKLAKRFLTGGAISLGLLIIISVLFVTLHPQVVWVSLEVVPSTHLLLLAMLGLLFTLFDTLLGLFLYLQERAGRDVVYLIWLWSILVNLVLTAAVIFISI